MSDDDKPFEKKADPARTTTRHHRILALTIGLPLASVLFVPWTRWRDLLFAWDLPEATRAPVMAAGTTGVLFLVAAFVPAKARRWALTLAGLAAGLCGLWLLGAIPASSRDLRHVGLAATRAGVLLAMFTVGAEMAMHRRPQSRAISVGAFLGWLGLLMFFFFVPIGETLEPEGTTASQFLAVLDRSYFRMSFTAPVFLWFAFVASFGLIQTLRRVGRDRALAAERPFRSSWLAWILYPVPLMALFAFGAFMMVKHDDTDDLSNIWLAFALVFGTTLGGAIGIRSMFLRERKATAPIPKRALVGVGAVLAIALAVVGIARVFSSAADEGAIDAIAWELAEAVEQGIRGEPFDPRFLGGYSELDLRNAEGVVDLPEGAEPAVVAFDVSRLGTDSMRTAVVRPDQAMGWVRRMSEYGPARYDSALWGPLEAIDAADPGFAALVESLDAPGCLPALAESALDEPAVAAAFERPPDHAPICADEERDEPADRVETLGGGRRRSGGGDRGAIERYVVVFAVPGASPIAVSGSVRAASGLAWIGNPTPWPADE